MSEPRTPAEVMAAVPSDQDRERRAADLTARARMVQAEGWSPFRSTWSSGEVVGVALLLNDRPLVNEVGGSETANESFCCPKTTGSADSFSFSSIPASGPPTACLGRNWCMALDLTASHANYGDGSLHSRQHMMLARLRLEVRERYDAVVAAGPHCGPAV